MSKNELKDLFMMIASVYPFFDPKDEEQQLIKLRTWYELLEDQSYKDVKSNLLDWMKSNDKAPLPVNLIQDNNWREEYETYD